MKNEFLHTNKLERKQKYFNKIATTIHIFPREGLVLEKSP